MALIDFTLSNARRFYSSMGNPLDRKVPIKSGYHHIDILQLHQVFLGFSWNFQGETRFYIFTVPSFGLSVAPYIFTKVLRPLVGWWRANGIYIAVFLDEGWSVDYDYN